MYVFVFTLIVPRLDGSFVWGQIHIAPDDSIRHFTKDIPLLYR